jgi:uncharacterized protein (TIGR02145 family)
MNAPSGTLIAYATSPGSTTSDGSGNNGLYTSAILESMKIPNITIIEMFQNVRSIVSQKSGKQQIPWESTSMTGNFYLNTGGIATSEFQKEIQVRPINDTPALNERDYIIDSRDNERYKTVKIGTQVWMAENLKTTKYRNGDIIGTTSPATLTMSDESTPKYQWAYSGNESNVAIHGRLYTWYAVTDSRNVCPTGWHVPSEPEWMTLTANLGGVSVAGGKLKETGTAHWQPTNQFATNETGFTALPGGYRDYNGKYYGIGRSGDWWSSTEFDTSYARFRNTFWDFANLYRSPFKKPSGLSVRCVKDF